MTDETIRRIANIAHHGGLIGFKTEQEALIEIRRLTIPWWDKKEAYRLQRESNS